MNHKGGEEKFRNGDAFSAIQVEVAGYCFCRNQLFQGNAEISQLAQLKPVEGVFNRGGQRFLAHGGIESDSAADDEVSAFMFRMCMQSGHNLRAVLIGQNAQVNHVGVGAVENLCHKLDRIAPKFQGSGQIITGAGGNVADVYSVKIYDALKCVVYGAVSAEQDQIDRFFTGGGSDFLSQLRHMTDMVGEIGAVGDIPFG